MIYELIETVLSRGLTINGVTISLLPVRHAKPARQPRILSPRHRDTALDHMPAWLTESIRWYREGRSLRDICDMRMPGCPTASTALRYRLVQAGVKMRPVGRPRVLTTAKR